MCCEQGFRGHGARSGWQLLISIVRASDSWRRGTSHGGVFSKSAAPIVCNVTNPPPAPQVRRMLLEHMSSHRTMFEPMLESGCVLAVPRPAQLVCFCGPRSLTRACRVRRADFDIYLSQMSNPMVWGGYPEQLAAEEIFDRRIDVYSSAEFEVGFLCVRLRTCAVCECVGFFMAQATGVLAPMRTHFEGDLPAEVAEEAVPIRLSYHGCVLWSCVHHTHPPGSCCVRASPLCCRNNHYNSLSVRGEMFPLGMPGPDDPHRILQHRLQRQSIAVRVSCFLVGCLPPSFGPLPVQSNPELTQRKKLMTTRMSECESDTKVPEASDRKESDAARGPALGPLPESTSTEDPSSPVAGAAASLSSASSTAVVSPPVSAAGGSVPAVKPPITSAGTSNPSAPQQPPKKSYFWNRS